MPQVGGRGHRQARGSVIMEGTMREVILALLLQFDATFLDQAEDGDLGLDALNGVVRDAGHAGFPQITVKMLVGCIFNSY